MGKMQIAPNYETVWAMLQEVAKSQKETDRIIKETAESQKETARQMEKTDRKLERVSKIVGGLGSSLGELIETLIAARLWEKFTEYNLTRAYRRIPIYNENNKAITEVDILLSNTEWVMIVEVKEEVREKDVEHHIKRMELIQQYPPAEAKGKKMLGAIAGGIVPPETQTYAHNAGFFVLELKGEAVKLITPPEGFSHKVW